MIFRNERKLNGTRLKKSNPIVGKNNKGITKKLQNILRYQQH